MADHRHELTRAALPGLAAADAATRPSSFATWLLQAAFSVALPLFYRREVIGLTDDAPLAGMLVVFSHLRDCDAPILDVAWSRRRGLRFRAPPPFFAAREDLFRPGILAELAEHWPRPLRALLGKIPLGWLFRIARAKPLRRVRELTLRDAAEMLVAAGCAGGDCATLLNARGLRELGIAPGAMPLAAVRASRSPAARACWGLRRLRREARARIAPSLRAAVATQLRDLASLLDAGHCVCIAPEGKTSEDGRFGRVRAGTWQIRRLAARAHPVRPVALSYDALRPGRLRVIVHGGAPLAHVASSARGFATQLRRSLMALRIVTPSHLLARYLVAGPSVFTTAELAEWMRAARSAIGAAGLTADRMLAAAPLEAQVQRRLRWLARTGIVQRERGRWRNAWPRTSEAGWRTPANIVRYLDNALADLSPELHRTLGR